MECLLFFTNNYPFFTGMRPESVDAQLKNHQENAKSLFKCPVNLCDYQSTSKVRVKKHFDSKHVKQYINNLKIPFQEIQKQVYQDPASGIKITRKVKSQLKQESDPLVTSPQQTSYVCRFCMQPASNMLLLKHHLMAHLDAGDVTKEDLLRSLYGCKQCDYIASHQDNLELHTQLIHGGESTDTVPCTESNQVSEEDDYKDSDLGHSIFFSEKQPTRASFSNFKCALCDFRTRYEDDVKEHFATQHNNPSTLDEAV